MGTTLVKNYDGSTLYYRVDKQNVPAFVQIDDEGELVDIDAVVEIDDESIRHLLACMITEQQETNRYLRKIYGS